MFPAYVARNVNLLCQPLSYVGHSQRPAGNFLDHYYNFQKLGNAYQLQTHELFCWFLDFVYDLLIKYKLIVDRNTYLNNITWKYMKVYNL